MTALKDAFWGLMMPVIILGGIYGGYFTPTEAAAVAAVYGILVGMFVYRKLKIKDLHALMVESAVGSAIVMFIVASAGLFAWFCTTTGISDMASDALLSVSGSRTVFLLLVNVILLIAGCFLDAPSALYIFTPLMLPVATPSADDPVALGVAMTVSLAPCHRYDHSSCWSKSLCGMRCFKNISCKYIKVGCSIFGSFTDSVVPDNICTGNNFIPTKFDGIIICMN